MMDTRGIVRVVWAACLSLAPGCSDDDSDFEHQSFIWLM